ncbi:hypothetical protein Tco_0514598 [Tanacetum coccineum]
MMRETELHKFSDRTLMRILEKLDHMVKDFKLFRYNPGMESRIYSEDDTRRSKYFMEVIKRQLKIRRIFKSLESFVSGRSDTYTGNPIKEILLKLNLPDHRLNNQALKLKELQDQRIIKLSRSRKVYVGNKEDYVDCRNMDKYQERQRDLNLTFHDLEKAYGSVPHEGRRLRWFGHVKKRPQSAPFRRLEALVVEGLRRRGRPKLRWEDRVKQDMKELLLFDDKTSDRNE